MASRRDDSDGEDIDDDEDYQVDSEEDDTGKRRSSRIAKPAGPRGTRTSTRLKAPAGATEAVEKKASPAAKQQTYTEGTCWFCGDGRSRTHNMIVMCSECNIGYHQACYGRPLSYGVPPGYWQCRGCAKHKASRGTPPAWTVALAAMAEEERQVAAAGPLPWYASLPASPPCDAWCDEGPTQAYREWATSRVLALDAAFWEAWHWLATFGEALGISASASAAASGDSAATAAATTSPATHGNVNANALSFREFESVFAAPLQSALAADIHVKLLRCLGRTVDDISWPRSLQAMLQASTEELPGEENGTGWVWEDVIRLSEALKPPPYAQDPSPGAAANGGSSSSSSAGGSSSSAGAAAAAVDDDGEDDRGSTGGDSTGSGGAGAGGFLSQWDYFRQPIPVRTLLLKTLCEEVLTTQHRNARRVQDRLRALEAAGSFATTSSGKKGAVLSDEEMSMSGLRVATKAVCPFEAPLFTTAVFEGDVLPVPEASSAGSSSSGSASKVASSSSSSSACLASASSSSSSSSLSASWSSLLDHSGPLPLPPVLGAAQELAAAAVANGLPLPYPYLYLPGDSADDTAAGDAAGAGSAATAGTADDGDAAAADSSSSQTASQRFFTAGSNVPSTTSLLEPLRAVAEALPSTAASALAVLPPQVLPHHLQALRQQQLSGQQQPSTGSDVDPSLALIAVPAALAAIALAKHVPGAAAAQLAAALSPRLTADEPAARAVSPIGDDEEGDVAMATASSAASSAPASSAATSSGTEQAAAAAAPVAEPAATAAVHVTDADSAAQAAGAPSSSVAAVKMETDSDAPASSAAASSAVSAAPPAGSELAPVDPAAIVDTRCIRYLFFQDCDGDVRLCRSRANLPFEALPRNATMRQLVTMRAAARIYEAHHNALIAASTAADTKATSGTKRPRPDDADDDVIVVADADADDDREGSASAMPAQRKALTDPATDLPVRGGSDAAEGGSSSDKRAADKKEKKEEHKKEHKHHDRDDKKHKESKDKESKDSKHKEKEKEKHHDSKGGSKHGDRGKGDDSGKGKKSSGDKPKDASKDAKDKEKDKKDDKSGGAAAKGGKPGALQTSSASSGKQTTLFSFGAKPAAAGAGAASAARPAMIAIPKKPQPSDGISMLTIPRKPSAATSASPSHAPPLASPDAASSALAASATSTAAAPTESGSAAALVVESEAPPSSSSSSSGKPVADKASSDKAASKKADDDDSSKGRQSKHRKAKPSAALKDASSDDDDEDEDEEEDAPAPSKSKSSKSASTASASSSKGAAKGKTKASASEAASSSASSSSSAASSSSSAAARAVPSADDPLAVELPPASDFVFARVKRACLAMETDFEVVATTLEEVEQFAQLMSLQQNPIDRALGTALIDTVIPDAHKFKKWIERRKRQNNRLVDNLSHLYAADGGGVYESRTRGVRKSYVVDDYYEGLGVRSLGAKR